MNQDDLPNRRRLDTVEFSYGGKFHTIGIGRASFDLEGPPIETWLDTSKSGSDAETAAKDISKLGSLFLRKGGTVDEIRKTLSQDRSGRPNCLYGAGLAAAAKAGLV